MNKVEKLFLKNCKENIRTFNYSNFKKNNNDLHKTIIETINEVNNKPINNFNLILIKNEIKKASFKIGKQKVFIFCGLYVRDNNKVILLENVETIGTYYLYDNNLCAKLKNYKIGVRIGIEKSSVGFNLTIGGGGCDIGLFDKY